MIMPPMVPVYDVNGNWAGPAGLDDFDNPVRKMTMGKDNINNYVKIIGNVFADRIFGMVYLLELSLV